MSLTPEGSRLLPIAEAALRSLTELDRAAGAPVSPAGELRVGAGDALGRELLPRALSEMLGEDPGLAVRLVEGPGARLVEQLRDGSIDLALVVDPGGAPRPGVRLEPLTTSPIDVLSAPPSDWVRERLEEMTLEEKVGQMIFVRAFGYFLNDDSRRMQRLFDLVSRKRVGGICHPEAAHALDVLRRDHVVMRDPGHGEGAHRARVAVGHGSGAAERHRRKQIEHTLGLLDDDGTLGHALEAEEAHASEPGVDVRQDVDRLCHLGERIAARVERVDHDDHGELPGARKRGP